MDPRQCMEFQSGHFLSVILRISLSASDTPDVLFSHHHAYLPEGKSVSECRRSTIRWFLSSTGPDTFSEIGVEQALSHSSRPIAGQLADHGHPPVLAHPWSVPGTRFTFGIHYVSHRHIPGSRLLLLVSLPLDIRLASRNVLTFISNALFLKYLFTFLILRKVLLTARCSLIMLVLASVTRTSAAQRDV